MVLELSLNDRRIDLSQKTIHICTRFPAVVALCVAL